MSQEPCKCSKCRLYKASVIPVIFAGQFAIGGLAFSYRLALGFLIAMLVFWSLRIFLGWRVKRH